MSLDPEGVSRVARQLAGLESDQVARRESHQNREDRTSRVFALDTIVLGLVADRDHPDAPRD